LAAEILAISDEAIKERLIEWRKALTNTVLSDLAAKGNAVSE
jgi:phosphoribosylcarboxyaminoimidazole (NCAIR) mutase